MKYRKKPVVIEAITFDELVEIGLKKSLVIEHGMPWSFQYKNYSITHENDDCYLIPTDKGLWRMNRGDMLITDSKGELSVCKPDVFAARYEAVV